MPARKREVVQDQKSHLLAAGGRGELFKHEMASDPNWHFGDHGNTCTWGM